MSMIEKEIEILRQLDHPNIIKLIDFKRTQNHYYLVFEYCENGDLDAYIRYFYNKFNKENIHQMVNYQKRRLDALFYNLHSHCNKCIN